MGEIFWSKNKGFGMEFGSVLLVVIGSKREKDINGLTDRVNFLRRETKLVSIVTTANEGRILRVINDIETMSQ